MNPYLPETVSMNPPVGYGIRPAMAANAPNNVPVRPIMPIDRNISNQQNYQHQIQGALHQFPNQQVHPQQQQQININRNSMQPQQNNRLQTQPQQQPQQQNTYEKPGALVREDLAKFQINPSNQTPITNQYNQGGKISAESVKNAMALPGQFSNPRQSIRPQLTNLSGNIPSNQTLTLNHKKVEDLRIASDRMQPNFQNGSPDNFTTQLPKDFTTKNLSDKNANSYNTMNAYPRRSETTLDSQGVKSASPQKPDSDKKPDSNNAEWTLFSAPEVKSNQNNLLSQKVEDKNNSKNDQKTKVNSDVKVKKITQKENKTNLKDDTITSGMVRKNIKFFEESDTAKQPLLPTAITIKKKTRAKDVPLDLVKCEFHKNEYESGVDERPIVFPSLRTIFQVPRKVARISRRAVIRHQKKHKLDKNIKSKLPPKFFKSFHLTPGSEKSPKIRAFGSNEELLAFFENSKSWRKHRYGKSGNGQNATKEKVAYKPTTNGDFTPKKTPSKLPAPTKANLPVSPTKSPLKSPGTPGAKSLPKTPESTAPATPLIKKVPMNKIQVGAAPSPNLKIVKSKVGSLANTTHKPGGGNVKIETHKIDLTKAQPRIEAKNEQYKPSGGDKKIAQVKLQWSAKSKIGSLENSTYKPGGGDKKIETVKLDFKEKAKPKVGSKDNVKHVPGGGNVKIENQKLDFKAQSKVGSLDNMKHKPGGGDIKIFDDKTYLRQVSGSCSEGRASGTQSYRDLSTTREVEGKSAPGTPGRKTTVKIKKITTFKSFEEAPKIEKVTEVTVTSKTPKDEKKVFESPIKQQVTLTYSKISSSKNNNNDNENSVEIVKVPANNYAPVLRPGLSKKEAFDSPETERHALRTRTVLYDRNSVSGTDEQSKELRKPSPISSGLPDGKLNLIDDSGTFKYSQNEGAKQEKIGEIWREINAVNNKSTVPNNRPQEEQSAFLMENEKPKSNVPHLKQPNSEFQFAQVPQNSSKQYQHHQMSQQSGLSSSFQQEFTVSPLQLNQSTVNRQLRQNPLN